MGTITILGTNPGFILAKSSELRNNEISLQGVQSAAGRGGGWVSSQTFPPRPGRLLVNDGIQETSRVPRRRAVAAGEISRPGAERQASRTSASHHRSPPCDNPPRS